MYTAYETVAGTYRLKVMMADIKWPVSQAKYPGGFEVFYTYSYSSGSGTFTYPDTFNIGDVMGTYAVTDKQLFFVVSHRGIEKLAEWVASSSFEYITQGGGGDIDIVKRLVVANPPLGDSIDTVSCQITGDYMVHTYRYRENSNGDILDRKLRVTNLRTGNVFNFTHADLKIEDVSPLGSDIKRWKLLAGIGVFERRFK